MPEFQENWNSTTTGEAGRWPQAARLPFTRRNVFSRESGAWVHVVLGKVISGRGATRQMLISAQKHKCNTGAKTEKTAGWFLKYPTYVEYDRTIANSMKNNNNKKTLSSKKY